MSQKRPNLLFCIADDASHYGCYGHDFVKTPHIDRAASDGIRFTSAFTTNPKCAPSRASILTGKHTWQNRESSQHWNYWPDDMEVFPDVLEKAGYFTGHTGKGWGPGDFIRCGRKHNPAGPLFEGRMLEPPKGSDISPKDYAANFDDFLKARPEGKPFYFWFGAHEPHRSYTYGEGVKNGKTLGEVTQVPPYWPDEESIRMDMLDYAFEIEWFDSMVGRMIKSLEDRGELENTLVIITSDNGAPFPRVKGQMYDDDFRLPFVALWKGKIMPGRVVDDLVSFTDIAPTFLEAADCEIPGDTAGKSLFDIFNADGSGTVASGRDRAYMGRERHDMGREGDLGYPVRCVRTPQYLYCRNMEPDRWPSGNPETYYTNCDSSPTKERIIDLKEKGENEYYWQLSFGKRPLEELYDIKKDPYCLENLAGKDEFAPLKADLWKELQTVLTETGDPRMGGDPGYFDTIEYFVDAPHSWEHYLAGDWEKQKY